MGNRMKDLLETTVLKDIATTEEEKDRLIQTLNEKPSRRPFHFRYLLASVAVLVLSVVFISSHLTNDTQGGIVDYHTKPEINFMEEVPEGMIKYHHLSDNMDRGNHDYYDTLVFIEPFKREAEISRGDIVLYEGEDSRQTLARVVGLGGETIKISNGQIYIDGKKLDTFYGKAHRLGLSREEYFVTMDQVEGMEYNKEGMENLFSYDLNEINLSDNEYFLVSDDWMRGRMITIQEDEIIGKVIGARKK
ncbi:S26 family signal peptidase [Sutcliffiella halmapala]|uniref:S26 family signal peptidase n=1 Tax=Sutcliffiella halmapala TaxID=79882 RepID=UPI000995372A|nr:S26 family signal peptidase [Sutcliffiella halmapala]